MRIAQLKKQAGFTLIEMIVSLGLFSVVITIAVGAMLGLINANEQLQAEQSVMTNLSFALDSMVREIRTGTGYYCDRSNVNSGNMFQDGWDLDTNLDPDDYRNCGSGNTNDNIYQGISFVEGGNSITGNVGTQQRIAYYYDANDHTIYRRIGNDNKQSIVSSGIYIANLEMYVSAARRLSGGESPPYQPTFTIFIEAYPSEDDFNAGGKSYNIQTTVTQRTLDI